MGAVLAALKGSGIAEKDIQTSRLSLQPQQSSRNPNGPVQITGYRASNRVTLTLRDVTKIASAIDTLVGAGANEVGGINLYVKLIVRSECVVISFQEDEGDADEEA